VELQHLDIFRNDMRSSTSLFVSDQFVVCFYDVCKFVCQIILKNHQQAKQNGQCLYKEMIFQSISDKMQLYTVYLYMETALHVSGGTSTHHQERIQLYLQHLAFVTPLPLPAVIVEELKQQ
jgi:hypothetical protein